jgi:hypothetical protein
MGYFGVRGVIVHAVKMNCTGSMGSVGVPFLAVGCLNPQCDGRIKGRLNTVVCTYRFMSCT